MTNITSILSDWSDWSEVPDINRRSLPETSLSVSKLVGGDVHVNSNTGFIPSTAYNRAYDRVSGKCAPYWDILNHSRRSGLQRILSTLVPKSIGEVVEVRILQLE